MKNFTGKNEMHYYMAYMVAYMVSDVTTIIFSDSAYYEYSFKILVTFYKVANNVNQKVIA